MRFPHIEVKPFIDEDGDLCAMGTCKEFPDVATYANSSLEAFELVIDAIETLGWPDVPPVQTIQKCSYWIMREKGRTSYPYKEHWRDCDACQASDPTGTATGIPADSRLTETVKERLADPQLVEVDLDDLPPVGEALAPCDHLTNGKMYVICKKCGVRTGGDGRKFPDEQGQTCPPHDFRSKGDGTAKCRDCGELADVTETGAARAHLGHAP